MMKRETVIEEFGDGVVVLALNRPARRNAFNGTQYDDVRAALAEAQANDEVRVAIITGAAGAFSAGQDLSEIGSAPAFLPFLDQLSTFEKPLLAAVNGVAVGIGFTLLLHCDILYLGRSARLRAPFVALGIVPEAGSTFLLPAAIGTHRAAEIMLTGRWIEAAEAVQLGLAARVVADEELMATAFATATEIAAQAPGSVRETKKLLLAARAEALQAARVREDAVQVERMGSPEILEALQAFQEKRPPSFGRRRG